MDSNDHSQPVLAASNHQPSSRISFADAHLHMVLQRYQDYHDQRSIQVQLEREVSQLRSYMGPAATDDQPADDSTRNGRHSARSAHERSTLLRARYSERTPSLIRDSSSGSNGGARGLRRLPESRRIKIGLVIDPVLQMPCFAVTPRSARAAGVPEVELAAINFILALEFPCWEHFHRDDFHHNRRHADSCGPRRESGHLLMASALCLMTASSSVFSMLEEIAHCGTAHDYIGNQASSPATWEGRGLSYKTLRSMVSPTNTSGTRDIRSTLELTPAQAWFEIESKVVRVSSARAPTSMTGAMGTVHRVDHPLLDRLKKQLSGLVTCSHFGAAMRRVDFEDAVEDVLRGR